MADIEEVVKGLECCYKYETHTANGLICEECPYNKENGLRTCSALMLKEALELLKEYDATLRLMVLQYCTRTDLDLGKLVFDHQFMCAGEEAFSLLGIKEGQQVTEKFENEY